MWGARVRMSVWVAGSVCTLVARACARQGPAHTRLGGRGALLGGHHGNSHLLPIPGLVEAGACVRACVVDLTVRRMPMLAYYSCVCARACSLC
jgi:hypothetical protein